MLYFMNCQNDETNISQIPKKMRMVFQQNSIEPEKLITSFAKLVFIKSYNQLGLRKVLGKTIFFNLRNTYYIDTQVNVQFLIEY